MKETMDTTTAQTSTNHMYIVPVSMITSKATGAADPVSTTTSRATGKADPVSTITSRATVGTVPIVKRVDRATGAEIEQSNSGSRSSRPDSERSGGDMTESRRVDDFFSQFTPSQTSFAPQSESSSVPLSATEPLNLSKISSATPPELQTSQLTQPTQPTQTTPPTQPIQTKTPTEPVSQPVFQTAITDSDEDVSSLWEKKLNPKRVTRSRK